MTARSGLLYWRLLRLRRVRPRPAITFLLFEGSIVLGALLALADLVTWWGAAAVPIAVAVMVKLNDVVASTLYLRPLAEAQLRTPRLRDGRRVGVSAVTRGGRPTRRIDRDDAVFDPSAWPDADIARGVASVLRRPQPSSHEPEADPRETAEANEPGATEAPHRSEASPAIDSRHADELPDDEELTHADGSLEVEESRSPDGSRSDEWSPSLEESRGAKTPRPDGADGRSRGNQGRFMP